MRVCQWDGCNIELPDGSARINPKTGYRYPPSQRRFCDEHFRERCRVAAIQRVKEPVGATKTDSHGYILIRRRGGDGRGFWEAEHRVVMAEKLGRPLRKGESVHHKNGRKKDNRPENLELWVGPIRWGRRARDIECPHCGELYGED